MKFSNQRALNASLVWSGPSPFDQEREGIERELAGVKAERDGLRALLGRCDEYLQHGPNCPYQKRQCDCGFDELSADVDQALKGMS